MRTKRLATTLAAIAAAAALAVGTIAATSPSIAVSVQPAKVTAGRTAKPTVVLVHGAWADSSAWDGVTERLQSDGYTVRSFPLPLRGLASDAAYLRSYLDTIPGKVVLVGHSYGGAIVTNAAEGSTNVTSLVYVDAFVPAEGETVVELALAERGSALAAPPEQVFNPVPYPGAPEGDVDLYIQRTVFLKSFANDLTRKEAKVAEANQRPVTGSAVSTPSGSPAWDDIPSWYFVGALDKVLPPAEQTAMAKRAGAEIVRGRAGHLAMVTKPGQVAGLIEAAAGR
jgi:pimeloyl-ACP methyl ester carboxylesterase